MDITAIAHAVPGSSDARAQSLARAAQEFEALVLAQFLEPLFSSVTTPEIAGGGPSEKAFQGLIQEEYARAIAARGGFGIAEQVKAALIELQAKRPEGADHDNR
jgi:Rod binding domain-containing protein